jgi:hypothetical protein
MEPGPCEDTSRLQRTFNWFYWEPANSAAPFQTELVIDTNIRVADTQTRVADTQTMVADTRMTVTNTHTVVADTQITVTNTETMVADMHRNMLTGQKGDSGNNHSVCATRNP